MYSKLLYWGHVIKNNETTPNLDTVPKPMDGGGGRTGARVGKGGGKEGK